MKKIISMVLGFMLVISLVGCGKSGIANVKIDYGASTIYTEEDMNAAIEIIKKEFSTWQGCEMHSLSYISDEACNNADILILPSMRKQI